MIQNVFILGNPRSGTSLLRLMLNNHPLIAAPPECGFMHWWFKKYKTWGSEDATNIDKITQFVKDLEQSKKIESWKLKSKDLISFLLLQKPKNYNDLTTSVYEFWALSKGVKPSIIIDKNNYYIKHLNDLLHIWQEAKFIFIVRDGRDVACSYLALKDLVSESPYKPKLPTDIKDIAKEWAFNNESIYSYFQNLNLDRFIIIRYEDLIKNSENTLTKISTFLSISYNDKMLQYYSNNDEPESTIDWKRKTLQKLDLNNLGKYKLILSEEQIYDFETVSINTLKLFGYV